MAPPQSDTGANGDEDRGADDGEPERQAEIVAFLLDPATHGLTDPVERVDTHISILFLAGDTVLKLKRAVRYNYVDFSTRDRRRAACETEIAINSRTAPEIYDRLVPVTREADGSLALDGAGEPVEWLVRMRRFDQDCLLDRVARRGALTSEIARDLADAIHAFHDETEPVERDAASDTAAGVIEGNFREIDKAPDGLFDAAEVETLKAETHAALDSARALLDRRGRDGLVRRCHGDLHLRNIVLLDGRPTLFDALEFDDALATTDLLYDLAFLLMDLEHRELRPIANAVLNRYLMRGGDYGGLPALPLFMAMRATIRAHTTVAAMRAKDDEGARDDAAHEAADEAADEARAYLALARFCLASGTPRLVAVGGPSGSGKSTVAARLAPGFDPAPGAIHLRSDAIRKRLRGVAPETKLGPEGYAADVTERVYDTLCAEAAIALDAGYSVVADAVFGREAERAALREVAEQRGRPFAGLWLIAPRETLAVRIGGRANDASDADLAVMERQIETIDAPGDWTEIDASGAPEEVVEAAREAVEPQTKS